jgi:hypothetical protein
VKKWKVFEGLITEIARKTAPNAIVKEDVRRRGKSGVPRQLDVLIEGNLGLARVIIAVECKDHRRRICAGDVEKFAGTVQDVSATGGIMISASGFSSGAQKIARERNVQLLSYRGVRIDDQTALLGENTHLYMIVDEFEISETVVHCEGEEDTTLLDLDHGLESTDGSNRGTVRDYRNAALRSAKALPLLGSMRFEVTPPDPLFLVDSEGRHRIQCLQIFAVKKAKMYTAAVSTQGHVLEDPESESARFRELVHTVDWRAICDSQEGREVTLSEYLLRGQPPTNFASEVQERDGILSLRLTQM